MSLIATLWKSIQQWESLVDKWKYSAFESINVDEISHQAEKFTKAVMKCKSGLPEESTAVAHLEKMVLDFKETMPIVTALGN